MKIGLDLSVIQSSHRMRGIGATAINFVNNIGLNSNNHTFVFFLYEKGADEAIETLNLERLDPGSYEIRYLKPTKQITIPLLKGPLRRINNILVSMIRGGLDRFGDRRIVDGDDIDSFIQFDPLQTLPRKRFKKGVVLYDLIPYILESHYLWNFKTSRQQGLSRKGSLRRALLRRQYIKKARLVARQADTCFAISENTKRDYCKFASIDAGKIQVTHLGINHEDESLKPKKPAYRLIENSWGAFPEKADIASKPFLLYVGGADARRKLNDVVCAYNHLRATDHDIRLVFAGDTMRGPESIPTLELRDYIKKSSYFEDIYFLGFVTDNEREWLYKNCIAFVYPSIYEGFGLPILEAMQYGTPVITYDNSSIREIAKDYAMYADGPVGILKLSRDLIGKRSAQTHQSLDYLQSFSWSKTVEKMISYLG